MVSTNTGPTEKAAEMALSEFGVKWDRSYPTIAEIWRRNWTHVTPFFAFPAETRKVIYTGRYDCSLHFFTWLLSAIHISRTADSSFGNNSRVLMIFRRLLFSDSTALVGLVDTIVKA